jgi:hypothetical protein
MWLLYKFPFGFKGKRAALLPDTAANPLVDFF